ncbi:16S rRNA m(7)G-527 methyltransferase [Halarsenatibacter silvermanii]|uniref:Ribosomal RNA small subunit methyltransferase G n=1 Tax=Halarsenatibacter silvermanii TaxID=321763 RepID=A0A1G9Q577_9FIRM|nr:16S rRNA m(7)G-527 methyltransferase [Halarsenatibacter silvermanii]
MIIALQEEFRLLKEGADLIGISLSRQNLENMISFLELLQRRNRRKNLIGTKGSQKIIIRHFLDCLAPLSLESIPSGGPVLDIGSGAGLPGFLWSLARPDIDFYLLDSRQSRIDFIRSSVNKLDIHNCFPIAERAEILGDDPDFREKFNFVTARAVARAGVVLEYALPLVRVSGQVGLYKGPNYREELKTAAGVAEKMGGSEIIVRKIDVPYLEEERYFLISKKVEKTPERFPRSVGVPEKRPL